jgi:hypothetical protein
MPFVNCQLGGANLCFPDVCKTPTPAGPVPIPYPNNSQPTVAVPACYTILMGGGPAHNMLSSPPISSGDNAGVAMGVASGMVMGPTKHMMGSTVLLLKGMPATRMLDMTGHNGATPNGVGATLVPGQTKVIVLR